MLRIRPPQVTGVKVPKIRKKRGSESKKPHPIFHSHQKRALRVNKSSFSLCCSLYRNGVLLTRKPLPRPKGKWGGVFSTPRHSFPDLGDFDPCKGRTAQSKRHFPAEDLCYCNQARTRSTNANLWGLDIFRWVGVFHVKGYGPTVET